MSEDSGSRHVLSVLLVESDQPVANLVMAALSLEGYVVSGCVASVDDAKQAATAQRPDLIMLDHRMIPIEEFDLEPANY